MSMLQTEDVMKSAQAAMEKKSPKTIVFSKLWDKLQRFVSPLWPFCIVTAYKPISET